MMEWISVKDRLPGDQEDDPLLGEYVLVFRTNITKRHPESINIAFWERYWKQWVGVNKGFIENVTHWCKLPEPPKDNEEKPVKVLDFTGSLHSGIELIVEDKE